MLSFSEKRKIQQSIIEKNSILANNPTFTEKRKAQQEKISLLAQLNINVDAESEPLAISEIDKAVHEAATSPQNDLPEPTQAQKESGNYKKGHVSIQGLDIAIENPQGSTRSGIDADGNEWSIEMANHYGYLKRTTGADGDQIDVFIGDNPESEKVFVVNQSDVSTGKFDEHKVMLGFNSEEEAKASYLANYSVGWEGLKSITEMSISEFKKTIGDGVVDKPIVESDLSNQSPLEQNEKTPVETTEPTPIAPESPLDQKTDEEITHDLVEQNLIAPALENEALAPVETRRPTAQFYEYDPNRKPAQRKRENAAAIALLNQIEAGDVDGTTLTDDQKATLAKYSGLGGALVGKDGQKGSAYEYYTPLPIAQGVWDLAKELGFSGGKVLDPCAGVGIFGATAPLNCVVDAVELDKTSGEINKLVNQGTGVSVTVSPFEKVAAVTGDDEYDAVVSNVPFGDNAARGANKNLDGKYRKENLQTYFILRSLEKLKPKGLAIFIVPTSIVDNKGAKEENLRIQASYMAEFLGAYRLPSKVFNTASTDVITDVIVFKKYDKDTLEKIQELREQNAETLIDANVQWQPFISGKYFLGEGKRFILGEFVPKDPLDNSQWARDKVINHAPLGEIGAMLRKFPDSRVKWDVLETTETAPIIYQEGDCITQAGQTLQYQQGQWIAVEARNQDIDADLMASNFASPQQAFETGMTYEQAFSYLEFMQSTSQILSAPSWLVSTVNGLQKNDNASHAKLWNAGIVGMTVADILGERLGSEEGVNFEEEYPKLSAAMLVQCGNAKSLTPKANGQLKIGLQTLAVHCKKGTGFSGLWRGDVAANAPKALTNESMSFDGLLYKNQSQWASIEDAKAIHGADFDPFKTDDYCISADGKSICKADDYYSGSYRKFLERADADIAAATDSTVKDKLLRQKLLAESKLDKIDVKNIGFTLNSPLVSLDKAHKFSEYDRLDSVTYANQNTNSWTLASFLRGLNRA